MVFSEVFFCAICTFPVVIKIICIEQVTRSVLFLTSNTQRTLLKITRLNFSMNVLS